MYRYSRAEFDRVNEFVRGLYEPRSVEDLIDHLLPAIRALVPVAFAGNAAYEPGVPARGHSGRTDPPGIVSEEIEKRLPEIAPRSPIAIHFQRTRFEQFMRWSDLQPMSQFFRTAFYNEVYRPWGVKDLCTLFLRNRRDRFELLGVGLGTRIPDAHRDMLVSISPHVQQAFRLAHTTSALMEMAATSRGPHRRERGIIAIDLKGTITMETAAATRALEKFFPKRSVQGLPEELARWVSWSSRDMRKATDVPEVRRPLMIERDGCRLTVNLFSRPEQNFLLLEEHRSTIDPAALSSLPLTRRESEILAYLAVGKTNPEIAIILGISSRTVSKHVEHILVRLGMETRTAAAATALEVANSNS
jgi:DNA-binding CsgD family transcriptional regulator